MRWNRIKKEESVQPEKGTYSDWKEIIAQECYHQCIYCAIHESRFGGIRNFHIEHYRPKSLAEFEHLINDMQNLYYACPVCNSFKGNDWPAEPNTELSNISYPDPSLTDYNDIIEIIIGNNEIKGNCTAAKYIIEKLFLNRPQLVLERRYYHLKNRFDKINDNYPEFKTILKSLDPSESFEYLEKYATLITKIHTLLSELAETRPYSNSDIKKNN